MNEYVGSRRRWRGTEAQPAHTHAVNSVLVSDAGRPSDRAILGPARSLHNAVISRDGDGNTVERVRES